MNTVLHRQSVVWLTNPFVGLRAFEESEDHLFFGRGKQIDDLLEKFIESRFLAVIGSSGSGKSSLIKSGLLPSIYSGFMTVGKNWRVAVMRPGENPVGYLAKELAKEGMLYDDTGNSEIPYGAFIEASLRRSENGLVQAYTDARLPSGENLLIVIDQFEELFRFSKYERENNLGKSDATHFIQIILAAIRQKQHSIYVLLTMRSDFLGDCAEFRGLPEAINAGQYLVPRMTRDEIREAVTGPVTVSGAAVSQRLVTRLLNSINNDADQLPVLQHAMMRTWDAWYKKEQLSAPIDFADYEAIGTMDSALSLHADEAYDELHTNEERRICELMFKALTDKAADIRGIRRPRSIADLCILTQGTEKEVKKIVEIFRKPGRTFLMPPPGVPLAADTIIDISHESLMRIWHRLVVWTDEETRSGDLYIRLVNSAHLCSLGQRGLMKNPELEIALSWKDQNNPTAKWAEGYRGDFGQTMEYLEQSREADLAEKKILAKKETARRRLVTGIVALLSILVIASIIVVAEMNRKNGEIKKSFKAEQRSKKIAEDLNTIAVKQKLKADSAKFQAIEQRKQADEARDTAVLERKAADAAKAEAIRQQAEAIRQKNDADASRKDALREKDISRDQTLRIAANEYARLIREGPSKENNNENEFYGDGYLLAYRRHFDRLETLVADKDRSIYRSLKNRLYYNNDLYQWVYKALKQKGAEQRAVAQEKSAENNLATKSFDNGVSVTETEDAVTLSSAGGNSAVRPGKGLKFIAMTVSRKEHLAFCSATNNFIYVYNDRLAKTDSIAMGTKVTALDYNDDNDLVYFGTTIGYIGYIKYESNKRNQPVFQNRLETEVTAIQLFRYGGQFFLLAAGRRSSPVVYKLEPGALTPDSHLIGNELPYDNSYGDITGAEYVPQLELVRLVTAFSPLHSRTATVRSYLWSPFTKELLDKLENIENFHPGTPATDEIIRKTKIYSEK